MNRSGKIRLRLPLHFESWGTVTIYLLAIFVLIVVGIIAASTDITVYTLVRDPEIPFQGFLSNLGILLWCSTATLCLFCSVILREFKQNRDIHRFLFFSGLMTSLLMLDDLFLLHEYDGLLIKYLGLGRFGFSEKTIFLGYAIILCLGILRFRSILSFSKSIPFYLALMFFALSAAIDVIFKSYIVESTGEDLYYMLEEGLKWMGIVSWFCYYTRTCLIRLKDYYRGVS